MTKQEEIRVGLICLCRGASITEAHDTGACIDDAEGDADGILNYLHSQGVVMKVGYEDDTPFGEACGECPLAIAVEPLIEEK